MTSLAGSPAVRQDTGKAKTRPKKQKRLEVAPNPYTFRNAMRHGDLFTYLSIIVWGLGNIVHGQVVKGLLWLLSEIALLAFLVVQGFNNIAGLFDLTSGGKPSKELFAPPTPASIDMFINGYIGLFVVACMVFLAWFFTRSAYRAQELDKQGKAPSIGQDLHDLIDAKSENFLMSLPVVGILIFTILPLIIMISIAFTNFDAAHGASWGWAGLRAFGQVFSTSGGGLVNMGEFFSVLVWTLVWAILATFLNYFLGMWVAMLILRPGIRLKGMWRAFFAMSIAVPQFVSLMVMQVLLRPSGVVNQILAQWGWIGSGTASALPFFTDPTWARVTVVIINLWVGIPFTIMQITGILQNVPAELYEAAKIDGASGFQIYRKITLPYLFFVMTPYLITTFVGNVNNFNVIYLLTGGGPATSTSATAPGSTDLLITWLYKLSVTNQNYNIGAVIGILTFVVLAVVSLITYQNSGSYRNEGGFN